MKDLIITIEAFIVFMVLSMIWGFPIILSGVLGCCCWLLLYFVWWVPAIFLTSAVVCIINKIGL